MKKLKATPGPYVKDYGGSIGHIKSLGVQDRGKGPYPPTPTICEYLLEYHQFFSVTIPPEEVQANGHLFAASWKLYHALEGMVSEFRSQQGDDELGPFKEIIEEAEAALAEARGERDDAGSQSQGSF